MNALQRSLLFFYTETPLHAGTGDGVGAIDLPLQRERLSELPQVYGSGIKGALREVFRQDDKSGKQLEKTLFGPRPPDSNSTSMDDTFAGALAVTDARLLLLPVRTARGGWAWVTSPLVLQRLARDIERNEWPKFSCELKGPVVTKDSSVLVDGKLVVEDSLYEVVVDDSREMHSLLVVLRAALPPGDVYDGLRERLSRQLVILPDEEFFHWGRHGTEIVTRIRIDPSTGTVDDGALWTEELLPSESLLWSVAMITDSRCDNAAGEAKELAAKFHGRLTDRSRIFLGGDRTIGRGVVALGHREVAQ